MIMILQETAGDIILKIVRAYVMEVAWALDTAVLMGMGTGRKGRALVTPSILRPPTGDELMVLLVVAPASVDVTEAAVVAPYCGAVCRLFMAALIAWAAMAFDAPAVAPK
jgi:hypothetical protein